MWRVDTAGGVHESVGFFSGQLVVAGEGLDFQPAHALNTLLNEARRQSPMELLPTTFACSSAVRWRGRVGERRVTNHDAAKVKIPKGTCIYKVGSCVLRLFFFFFFFKCTTA